MRRLVSVLAVTLASLLSAAQSTAQTNQVAVGACKPNLKSYSTISQAVSDVPSGATVFVCPGNYPEQVSITVPLTLKGVQIGNSGAAVITVPATGLVQNVVDEFGFSYAAQLLVRDTAVSGPVNISGIAVDGSNNGLGGPSCPSLAGIYYQNASGTLSRVAARNQAGSGCGFGILAEAFTAQSVVTIQNSSVHNFDGHGIAASTDPSSPFLTVAIQSNAISSGLAGPGSAGILAYGAAGTVQSNTVSRIAAGIGLLYSTVSVTSNTLSGNGQGTVLNITGGASTIKSNKIDAAGQIGMLLLDPGANIILSNTIVNSSTAIAGCYVSFPVSGNTVRGNTIMDATTGISLPSGNVAAPNTYANVASLVVPCS